MKYTSQSGLIIPIAASLCCLASFTGASQAIHNVKRDDLVRRRADVFEFWKNEGRNIVRSRGVISPDFERLDVRIVEAFNENKEVIEELLDDHGLTVTIEDGKQIIQEHLMIPDEGLVEEGPPKVIEELLDDQGLTKRIEDGKQKIHKHLMIPHKGFVTPVPPKEMKKFEKLLQMIPVTTGENEEEEGANGGRRRHGRRRAARRMMVEAKDVPYPADGGIVTLNTIGAEIHFEEDATLAVSEITCFYFDKDNDGVDVSYTCDDIVHDVEAGVATVSMKGLSEGSWTWWAEDRNGTATSKQTFTVEVTPGEIVRNSGSTKSGKLVGDNEWTYGGQIQGTAGRIYYSSAGVDYACTGTAIRDNKSGRSLIVTAAHCVWDDIDENWGSNVVFIPNRDATSSTLTGEEIHRQCTEDVCGCWTASAGFVHDMWKDEPWPARLAYDWGIWVVDDVGAHNGPFCGSEALDEAVEPMDFEIGVDLMDLTVTGLGYSLEYNPDFRYCTDQIEYRQPTADVDTYWLPECGLSGGASGGPWLKDADTATGTGKLVSVNSWSLSNAAGMGGPIIDAEGARCLVNAARDANFEEIEAYPAAEEGVFVNCYRRDCIPADEVGADTSRVYNRRLRGRKLNICDEDGNNLKKAAKDKQN